MKIDETFSQLLGDLYQGPLETQPWQTFLSNAREVLGAHLVTLLLRPPSKEDQVVMLADGGSLSAIKSYNEGQFVLDPFVDLPTGEPVCLREFLSDDVLQNSEFFRIIMQPQGWNDFLGLDIRNDKELDVRFRAGRYHGAPAFGSQEKRLVRALHPHLERSIALYTQIRRSESERAIYAGAVEQLQVATIILDEQCLVLSINAMADELLAAGDAVAVVNRQLQLIDREASTKLQQLLAAVIRAQRQPQPLATFALQVPRANTSTSLGLIARPVPPSAGAQGRGVPSIAVFISDPLQAAGPAREIISSLFGLTPAEASLAVQLSHGLTLDEAAQLLGVSRNTARTHLRAVFAKTGVARQSGLIRLILSSVAPLGGGSSS